MLLEKFKESVKEYHEHFKIGGIKLLSDGSPQGSTAWMKTPYAGETEYCGYPSMKAEEMLAHFKYALEHKLQVLVHCNGDAACEQCIRVVEKLHETYPVIDDMRTVMVHAQLLQREQVPAVKAANMLLSFFVVALMRGHPPKVHFQY